MKRFDVSDDATVVTSSYVTNLLLPILVVFHELDEEGGSLWQFHCGNDDYSMEKMQLVRLDTILRLDPSVLEVADLPVGGTAQRRSREDAWIILNS
jgi:hypothetical protein